MENKFNINDRVFLKKDIFCNVFNIVGIQYENKEFIYKLSSSRGEFISYELESELELVGREKLDDTKVTYTITVDKKLFPSAPGTEVVVRDGEWDLWRKDVFVLYRPNAAHYSFLCEKANYRECYPMSTHAHLIGTTYPSNTPACPKCGKAMPDCECEYEFKPFQQVLVRDTENDEWAADIFSHIKDEGYMCAGDAWWKCCIPFSGNEHLLGTTNEPK